MVAKLDEQREALLGLVLASGQKQLGPSLSTLAKREEAQTDIAKLWQPTDQIPQQRSRTGSP